MHLFFSLGGFCMHRRFLTVFFPSFMLLPVLGTATPDSEKSFLATADMMNVQRSAHIYEETSQESVKSPVKSNKRTISHGIQHGKNAEFKTSFYGFGSFRNVSSFHLRAALKIQLRMKQRGMKLVDYRFADTNNDGKPEVVTLSEVSANRGNAVLVLGVYDFDEEFNPILRYEKTQSIDNAANRTYAQRIESRSPGFSFCESWQIASWNIDECHEIIMDLNWNPGVVSHQIRTSEPKAHSVQSNAFNFETGLASRTYDRLPEGPFMPPLHRTAAYHLLFSNPDKTLAPVPARLSSLNPVSMQSEDHLPILLGSKWNEHGLYFSIVLSDNDIVADSVCHDQASVQLVDHIEFWFDKSPDLAIQSDNPQSWLLEYRKDYNTEPYRHSLDNDIFGFAVTAGGCLVPMAPTRDAWPVMPQMVYEKGASGYRVDVFVPAAFFGVSSLNHIDHSLGIGLSVRQHDIHDDDSWQSIATSNFHWPDPFTIGQIWLPPSGAAWPPPFPMQWSSWLVDN